MVKEIHLFQLGVGQVGKAFLRLILRQKVWGQTNFKLVGLVSSKARIINRVGFDDYFLEAISRGAPFSDLAISKENEGWENLTREVKGLGLDNLTILDFTSEANAPFHKSILDAGFSLVTVNKNPLVDSYEFWRSPFEAAILDGRYGISGSVGAGLPIIDALLLLRCGGEGIEEISGLASGTLSFIFDLIMKGSLFSVAVRDAFTRGYTEPHPRDDLSGFDVARKALILGRVVGAPLELKDVQSQSLYSPALSNLPRDNFLKGLTIEDCRFRGLVQSVSRRRENLAYVFRFREGKLKIGLETFSANHQFAKVFGPENVFCVKSDSYSDYPLIISGPGASPERAARAAMNDVLRMAGKVF